MAVVTRQDPEKWSRDRRLGNRYPINADVEYRIMRQGKVVQTGRGRTLNVSSSGVLLQVERPLPPGCRVELSIDWPVRLQNIAPLQLCVVGRTVRCHDNKSAVRISSYDFRTKGVSGAGVAGSTGE